jgi:23S rRNA (cytidine1920-2'-O)/16S rRNA (cytidine1409-2'-O)-methyltransferase
MGARRRLDAELVRRGLAGNPTEAQAAVRDGLVVVAGHPAHKPSTLVGPDEAVALQAPTRRFVSRGGEKLDAALIGFGIDVGGRDCLDAGASTGGFTDCLLQRGAARVAAVDVGYGQLAWSLRTDPRVTVIDRTNVRGLTPGDLPFAPGIVVADLSFISLRLVLAALVRLADPRALFVLLVKPQFEAGPSDVGAGGVVRDPAVWRRVLEDSGRTCAEHGLAPQGVMASPVLGPAGNVEFLLAAEVGGEGEPLDIERAAADGLRFRGDR